MRVCLPGCCEASRTRLLRGLPLALKSPPTIKRRKRRGLIDHECGSSKSSVTFITSHFSRCAVNAEQGVKKRKRQTEQEKWCLSRLCVSSRGSSRDSMGRYCYQWIKHETISLYQSTIFYIFPSLHCHGHIVNLQHMISHQSHLTQHIISSTTALVNWDVYTAHFSPGAGFYKNRHRLRSLK